MLYENFYEIEEMGEFVEEEMEEFPSKDREKRRKNFEMKNKEKIKKKNIVKISKKRGLGLRKRGNSIVSRNSKKNAKRYAHKIERKAEYGNGKSYKGVYDLSKERKKTEVKEVVKQPLCRFVLQI